MWFLGMLDVTIGCSACLLHVSVQVPQGEQLRVVRNGLLIKDDIGSLMALLLYWKSRSEELLMHPSRRVSFGLFFLWENTPGRSTRAACKGFGWEAGSSCFTTRSDCVLSFTSCPGGLPSRAQTVSHVFKPWSQGKPSVSHHISFSTGSFASGLSHWQSRRFCCCMFAMLFDWNRYSACILESCLLFVVRERMWQDARVARSCDVSH